MEHCATQQELVVSYVNFATLGIEFIFASVSVIIIKYSLLQGFIFM